MTTMNWLTIFGVPSLIAALVAYVRGKFKKEKLETDALKLGIQALLRDRLYQLYRCCRDKGFAEMSERQNFENMYKQYHNLGANGVMDDIRGKLLGLPTKEEE